MRIQPKYLAIALALFGTEVLVATKLAHFQFIRGSLGDFLVVPLIYFAIQAFWPSRPKPLAIGVVLFAFVVEGLQYVHFADRLGLPRGSVWSILLGNSFSWQDLLMYLLGGVATWAVDVWWLKNTHAARLR